MNLHIFSFIFSLWFININPCGHHKLNDNLITETQFRAIYQRVYSQFGTPSRGHYERTLYIAKKESNRGSNTTPKFSRTLKNSKSTAYGMFQFLNKTWNNVGVKKTDCAECQMVGFFKYIQRRYSGSIERAYNHHKKHGWY